MGNIRELDPHVANLIAAGEVVERPASVVKELMENAIDAGANQLTVEIQNGGMSLIRVTDNGSGIAAEDIETAFLRHATSKLRRAEDLEAIGSLGFRGEALAAIAAVSRLEILSRMEGEEFGANLVLEGGTVRDRQQIGCPLGTTMVVRDLFFNTPARQKYMKRDVAEGAAVFALVQRVALSRPDICVKFLKDGKQELLTPGDGKLASAMYSVFGRDIALGFTEVKGRNEEIIVTGFVSLPTCCRGTRSYQHFILNGRSIKSQLLSAAVEEAYRNQKMVGRFPGCVLHIEAKLGSVDVNVHPAKTQVKFLSEKKIFDAVHYSVRAALGDDTRKPEIQLPTPTRAAPTGGFQEMNAQQFRDSMAAPARTFTPTIAPRQPLRPVRVEGPEETEPLPPVVTVTQTTIPMEEEAKPVKAHEPQPEVTQSAKPDLVRVTGLEPQRTPEPEDIPISRTVLVEAGGFEPQRATKPEAEKPAPEPPPVEQIETVEETPWRMAGEVMNTYIIVEQGDKIFLIDKHAAHERMHFDRMKRGEYQPMAQSLLEPLVFTPAPEEAAMLLSQLPLLEDFGFSLEDFGGGALLLRQLPFDIAREEAEGCLSELAEKLLAGKRQDPSAARDELLHSMACKAAIKGGQRNAAEELLAVAKAVMAGEVQYCPHGRPVAITLTRAQLERQFGRS